MPNRNFMDPRRIARLVGIFVLLVVIALAWGRPLVDLYAIKFYGCVIIIIGAIIHGATVGWTDWPPQTGWTSMDPTREDYNEWFSPTPAHLAILGLLLVNLYCLFFLHPPSLFHRGRLIFDSGALATGIAAIVIHVENVYRPKWYPHPIDRSEVEADIGQDVLWYVFGVPFLAALLCYPFYFGFSGWVKHLGPAEAATLQTVVQLKEFSWPSTPGAGAVPLVPHERFRIEIRTPPEISSRINDAPPILYRDGRPRGLRSAEK